MRPALHKDIYRDSLLLLLPGLCKAGRTLFWGVKSDKCDLPCAKRVALFFEVESGKCDLLCAKQVALSSRVTTFQTLLTLRGQDSESNDFYLGKVRPALRKAGRTLAIGL